MAQHNKKFIIKLSPHERTKLEHYARSLRIAAQKKQRAQILLLANQGEDGKALPDSAIVRIMDVSLSTVERVREYAYEVGPIAALTARKRNRTYELVSLRLAARRHRLGLPVGVSVCSRMSSFAYRLLTVLGTKLSAGR